MLSKTLIPNYSPDYKQCMKVPVLSTSKILMCKLFNYDIDESWVDWAIEMMEAGFESENLYMLAGISRPFNQFELQDLTNKVLKDLQLDFSDKDLVIKNYTYYIILNSINHPEKYLVVLRELKEICLNLNLDADYMNFYLLYFAKADLIESEMQWYWDDANRDNIDDIIKSQFTEWLINFR